MEPDQSGGVGAVEVAVEQPVPTFVHGACAGIALAAIGALCWLAMWLAPLRDAYRDMGGRAPFVVHPAWSWGAPAAGLVALVVLVVRRPRSLVPDAAVAVALVLAVAATWHFAYAPLNDLASDIQG